MDNCSVTSLLEIIYKYGYTKESLPPLSVNIKTGRAWLQDGNHCIAAIIRLEVEWVPIQLEYRYIYKDNGNELFYPPVPRFCDGMDNWSDWLTADWLTG